MATHAELEDPLYNLRLSITSNLSPVLTNTSTTTPTPADVVTDLAHATHILFNAPEHHKSFDITVPTRYAPDDKPIDLRSIYFAWVNKDAVVTDYFAAVQRLNEDLPSGAGGSVLNLSAAQRIELISWLSGEVDASESITPLEGANASAAAGDAAAIAGGKGVPVQKGTAAGGQKMVDARLLEIYDGERRMGDHNTALRGTKPIDFSAYRKIAATFLRSRPDAKTPAPLPQLPLPNMSKKPSGGRQQPVILLSPSATSLLRMTNIKSFLEDGIFRPPNEGGSNVDFLQGARVLPSISSQPLRFFFVDSTTKFKSSYWDRVVAVFTTGQPWQFRSYKYPNPIELFNHYPGVYVGWDGENEPETVKAWGRGVLSVKIDKWTGSEKGRWRDREVVERIWARIEEGMRRNGWTKDGPGLASQQPGR